MLEICLVQPQYVLWEIQSELVFRGHSIVLSAPRILTYQDESGRTCVE